jgi:hypothetical protein
MEYVFCSRRASLHCIVWCEEQSADWVKGLAACIESWLVSEWCTVGWLHLVRQACAWVSCGCVFCVLLSSACVVAAAGLDRCPHSCPVSQHGPMIAS